MQVEWLPKKGSGEKVLLVIRRRMGRAKRRQEGGRVWRAEDSKREERRQAEEEGPRAQNQAAGPTGAPSPGKLVEGPRHRWWLGQRQWQDRQLPWNGGCFLTPKTSTQVTPASPMKTERQE